MTRRGGDPPQPGKEWRELRDAKGRLYGRINRRQWLLEIKRNDRDGIAHFDLRVIVKELQSIAPSEDIE